MFLLLAALSSLLWGIGDFAGGTASRRLATLRVVLFSQLAGLVAALIAAVAMGEITAPLGYLRWAPAAGVVGAVGLLAFYHALAIGTMGIVSPIAALGVVVPVVAGFVTGQWPVPIVGAGIAVAIIGVVAASGPERSAGRSLRPVVLALVAAVCFGTTLLLIARGAQYSPLMTMVGMRVSSVVPLAVVVAVRARRSAEAVATAAVRPSRSTYLVVTVAGLFDVGANLTFALASTGGALAIVAVLGSLYPAVTVLLARIVHAERMTRVQQGGVILALIGVGMIAGWS